MFLSLGVGAGILLLVLGVGLCVVAIRKNLNRKNKKLTLNRKTYADMLHDDTPPVAQVPARALAHPESNERHPLAPRPQSVPDAILVNPHNFHATHPIIAAHVTHHEPHDKPNHPFAQRQHIPTVSEVDPRDDAPGSEEPAAPASARAPVPVVHAELEIAPLPATRDARDVLAAEVLSLEPALITPPRVRVGDPRAREPAVAHEIPAKHNPMLEEIIQAQRTVPSVQHSQEEPHAHSMTLAAAEDLIAKLPDQHGDAAQSEAEQGLQFSMAIETAEHLLTGEPLVVMTPTQITEVVMDVVDEPYTHVQ